MQKLLSKIEETLEVSFGDEEIEKVNQEVVNKVLEQKQMQTFLRGFIVITQMASVLSQSVKMLRKLSPSLTERNSIWKPLDESYDGVLSSFKKLKLDLKEVHPQMREAIENAEEEAKRANRLGIQRIWTDMDFDLGL